MTAKTEAAYKNCSSRLPAACRQVTRSTKKDYSSSFEIRYRCKVQLMWAILVGMYFSDNFGRKPRFLCADARMSAPSHTDDLESGGELKTGHPIALAPGSNSVETFPPLSSTELGDPAAQYTRLLSIRARILRYVTVLAKPDYPHYS
jgi:hypothetical protein